MNTQRQENKIGLIFKKCNSNEWKLVSTSTAIVDTKNQFSNLYLFCEKQKDLKEASHHNDSERSYRISASSLMHRPGKARRGVKVGFRFQLQDWFTSTSRQSPHVEIESDQST